MNSIIIKGRMANNPDLKRTNNGTAVCSFTVAVDREYQKQNEDKVTDWFRCNAWKNQAEFIAKYFEKGQEILIRGGMQSHKYEDGDGKNQTAWEIQVDRAEFCGSKKSSGQANTASTDPAEGFTDIEPDDIPF